MPPGNLPVGGSSTNPTFRGDWRARLIGRLAVVAGLAAVSIWVLQTTIGGGVPIFVLFFSTLALAIAWAEVPPVGEQIAAAGNRIAGWLERRRAFQSNALAEAPKFALLRIIFGLFLVQRAAYILIYLFPTDWSDPWIVAAAIANLVTGVLVLLGLFTQVALAFLILVQWQPLDNVLGTSTLGNDVAAMLAVLMMIANAGAHYSIDAVLRKRAGLLGRAFSFGYFRFGLPATNTLQIAKLMALGGYWCVCVYSLMMHLSEPAWMSGVAGPLLLTSNFMSAFYAQFEQFFELGPVAIWLGRISLWAMLPWYALILPFVLLGGIWRTYVIGWGILFFLLSMFVLQLGWLSHFEFLMFAALFWNRAWMLGPRTLQVAYDDRCNLCDRTVTFVRTVDVFRRVELRPLTKNREWLQAQGIDPSAALQDLHGIETDAGNRKSRGYDLYIALSRRVFLLSPFYPVLVFFKWIGVGPAVYRFVADRRTKMFGVCEIPTPKPDHELLPAGVIPQNVIARTDAIVPVATHFALLAFFYLITIPAPFIGWTGVPLPPVASNFAVTAGEAAHIYGVAPIDVFNQTDLRMSENWFTLTAVDDKGEATLLPILSEHGTRLAMHASDRVYFGNTLRYRRGSIDKEGCLFEQNRPMLERLVTGVRVTGAVDHYVYRQFRQPLPDAETLLSGAFSPNPVTVACTQDFTLSR